MPLSTNNDGYSNLSGKYIYQIQIDNPQLFFDAVESLEYRNRRLILMILVNEGGTIDVSELRKKLDIPSRTMRNQLQSLEELDLIDRHKGHCAAVSFSSRESKYLANHVLDCFFKKG